jgi:hypothetical protein
VGVCSSLHHQERQGVYIEVEGNIKWLLGGIREGNEKEGCMMTAKKRMRREIRQITWKSLLMLCVGVWV